MKMSPKGQLVVPQDIRQDSGFKPGDRFVPFAVKNGVLFKRVRLPNVRAEFEKLAQEIQKDFQKRGVTENEVGEAVRWSRRRSS